MADTGRAQLGDRLPCVRPKLVAQRDNTDGPVVSGDTLEAAVFATEELEETAKLYLLLRGLNPRYLSPQQVADLTKVLGLTLPEHDHS